MGLATGVEVGTGVTKDHLPGGLMKSFHWAWFRMTNTPGPDKHKVSRRAVTVVDPQTGVRFMVGVGVGGTIGAGPTGAGKRHAQGAKHERVKITAAKYFS